MHWQAWQLVYSARPARTAKQPSCGSSRPAHSALQPSAADNQHPHHSSPGPDLNDNYPFHLLQSPLLCLPQGPRHPGRRPPRWYRAAPAPCCTPRPSPWQRLQGGGRQKQVLVKPQPPNNCIWCAIHWLRRHAGPQAGRVNLPSSPPKGHNIGRCEAKLPRLTAAQQADRLQGRRLVDFGHRHLVHDSVLCRWPGRSG